MNNLDVVEEYVRFSPVRISTSPQALLTRFIETTTFSCGLVWSLLGTALVHWAPIKTTPRQFGIDSTMQHSGSKSHQTINTNLPASLTTLIDWVFISAYSKYLVVKPKAGIICKWSRFDAEWFRSGCGGGLMDRVGSGVVLAMVFGTCCETLWLVAFCHGKALEPLDVDAYFAS